MLFTWTSAKIDTDSHSLLDKLAGYRLNEWSLRWVGNWLTGCAQRVVVNSFHSGGQRCCDYGSYRCRSN